MYGEVYRASCGYRPLAAAHFIIIKHLLRQNLFTMKHLSPFYIAVRSFHELFATSNKSFSTRAASGIGDDIRYLYARWRMGRLRYKITHYQASALA